MNGIVFSFVTVHGLENGFNGLSKEVVWSLIARVKITCSALELKFLQQQIPSKVVVRLATA